MSRILIVPVWAAAMAWHLWRILIGQPAFRLLGDTKLPALSFLMAFLAASVIRHSVVGSVSPFEAMLNASVYGVFLILLAERGHRSSSLTFSFMGVSAGVDLVVSGLLVLGWLPASKFLPVVTFVWEILLMTAAYVQFRREPFDVQARGYRPNGRASVR